MNPEEASAFGCRECQVGKMTLSYMTYMTWLGDEVIMVPDFPAWVCDVCGRREYDQLALTRLTMLLNSEAGKPVAKPRSIRPVKGHKTTRPNVSD